MDRAACCQGRQKEAMALGKQKQLESFHGGSGLTEENGYPDTQDQSLGNMEMLKIGAHTHSLVDRVC